MFLPQEPSSGTHIAGVLSLEGTFSRTHKHKTGMFPPQVPSQEPQDIYLTKPVNAFPSQVTF